LLDFTTSFWIALFFAFEQEEKECAVVALNPDSLREKGQKGKDFNLFLRENIANGAIPMIFFIKMFHFSQMTALQSKRTGLFSRSIWINHSMISQLKIRKRSNV